MHLLITGHGAALRDELGTAWGACAACAAHIEADDLDGLISRVLQLAPASLRGDPTLTEAMVTLQAAFLRSRHPGRIPLTPAEALWRVRPEVLPKLRDRLAAAWTQRMPDRMAIALRAGDPVMLPARLLGPDPPSLAAAATTATDPAVLQRFGRDTADTLGEAGLYWISEEFTDLAVHAAGKLPDLAIDAHQIPAGHGLVVWAHPIARSQLGTRPLPIVAAHWRRLDGGLWVCFYTPAGLGRDGLALQRIREDLGWLTPFGTGLAVPYAGAHATDTFTRDVVGGLIATWLLIDQPRLATTQRLPADRPIRRAYARAGRPDPQTRVVRLRASTARGQAGTPTSNGREYTHRWWVDPYWRDQPYGPGRSLRRRRLVAGSVRGPDDKPLRLKPTVRVLGSTRTPPPVSGP
jgi:hypothetical protein